MGGNLSRTSWIEAMSGPILAHLSNSAVCQKVIMKFGQGLHGYFERRGKRGDDLGSHSPISKRLVIWWSRREFSIFGDARVILGLGLAQIMISS